MPVEETMSQQRQRILGSDPCDELKKSEIANHHLKRNQENFRQFNRKLERTADAMMTLNSNIYSKFRENIKTLEW